MLQGSGGRANHGGNHDEGPGCGLLDTDSGPSTESLWASPSFRSKTLQTVGPSHARTYTVAVYFKGERIGCGKGPSIQQAEMGAAMDALEKCKPIPFSIIICS